MMDKKLVESSVKIGWDRRTARGVSEYCTGEGDVLGPVSEMGERGVVSSLCPLERGMHSVSASTTSLAALVGGEEGMVGRSRLMSNDRDGLKPCLDKRFVMILFERKITGTVDKR